jgi:hypothetical protein
MKNFSYSPLRPARSSVAAKAALQDVNFWSDEETESQTNRFYDTDSDSNTSDSTEYFSDVDSNTS